jgi:hypothetical protein
MGWRLAMLGLTGLNLIVVAALLGPCQHASAAATAADTLRAKAIDTMGVTQDITQLVRWSGSNPSALQIDADGRVLAAASQTLHAEALKYLNS